MTDLAITFHGAGRKAEVAPNPEYPEGIDIDCGFQQMCAADLPYPAPECGFFKIECSKCGAAMAYTAAGRLDDPRRVTVPCQAQGNRQIRSVARLVHGVER